MAITPAERGVSHRPDIKLTHQMTVQDVEKIAIVTGGVIKESGINAKPYYDGQERLGPQRIQYPELDAEIDFIGKPLSIIMGVPQGSLRVDKNEFTLVNSAVIIGEGSVTFVRRPQAETDEPFELTAHVSAITITPKGITYEKGVLEKARGWVLEAAVMIDQAYRAKQATKSSPR